jgi:hypothetical protein
MAQNDTWDQLYSGTSPQPEQFKPISQPSTIKSNNWDSLYSSVHPTQPASNIPQTQQVQQPGFFSRLYEGTIGPLVGLGEDYTKHIQEHPILNQYGLAGFPALGQTAWDVSSGIGQGIISGAQKTSQAAKSGDVLAALRQAPSVVPGVGQTSTLAGEDLNKGNYLAELGDITSLGVQALLPEVAKGLPELPGKVLNVSKYASDTAADALNKLPVIGKVAPEDALMQGLRPQANKINFKNGLTGGGINDLLSVEQSLGKPIESLEDLLGNKDTGTPGAIKIAKNSLMERFKGMQPNGLQVDASPVADAIDNTITKKMRFDAQSDPALANQIQAIQDHANLYRKGPINLEDLADYKRSTTAALDSYYDKFPQAKKAAAASNPETAVMVAEEKALNNAIYSHLDDSGMSETGRDLMKRWGNLNDIEDVAFKRQNVLERQAPENLSQQMSKIAAAGQILKGTGKILTSPLTTPYAAASGAMDIAQALGETKMADWLRERNGTNGLIKRAFNSAREDTGISRLTPETRESRMLPSPTIKLGGIPDTSGTIPFNPPPSWYAPTGNLPKGIRGLLGPATQGPEIPYGGQAPLITTPPGGFEIGAEGKPIPSVSQSGNIFPENPRHYNPVPSGPRLLSAPSQPFINPQETLGSQFGEVTNMVPRVNPLTGETEYIPNPMKAIRTRNSTLKNPTGPTALPNQESVLQGIKARSIAAPHEKLASVIDEIGNRIPGSRTLPVKNIQAMSGMDVKTFNTALNKLSKQGRISITPDGTNLIRNQ